MSISKSSDLFYLIKSMTKSEKRAFKIYAKRGSGTQHLFLTLFDLIDNLEEIDDELIIKKMKFDTVGQYSNLKRHLYSQIMNSLRMLNVDKKPNIKIREYIDMAYVLYGKGLYMQALQLLNIAKQLCKKYGTDLSLLTILEFEKNIHSRHITRTKREDFDLIFEETENISHSLTNRVLLTNLKMKLHKMYIQEGHVKNDEDFNQITTYFNSKIAGINYEKLGIMEKIYYCQCYVWYNYVINDYNDCLKYAKQWVVLFKKAKDLQKRDYNLFLRGFHYVLTSAFNLGDFKVHDDYLNQLEIFRESNYSKFNKNNKIFSFLYTHTGRLNNVILSYDFQKGLELIPRTLSRIKRYSVHLDQHKIMVIHYKIAWIYIGANKAKKALPYLEGIIELNRKSLREDIQSYARLMHLMALYNLDDYDGILLLLRKYKYYFQQVKEMNNLQKTTLRYFQQISTAPIFDRKNIHENFLSRLKEIKSNKFEKNAFLYLDLMYWLENHL